MLTQPKVGRFEVLGLLGRGAVGDVHLARDPLTGSEIALKLVHTAAADPEMLLAEKNGARLQKQLAEAVPQVAAVYELGEDDPFFWVAMEHVPGVDLSTLTAAGPLPEERAVRIALQICAILDAAHRFSAEIDGRRVTCIIHGDIKPENIRLQDGDRVRILDFGIAKQLSQTRQFTVNLFGSLPYTPPERLERGVVDQAADLWAAGVVLYCLVSGRAPYAGRTAEELETKIRRGEPIEPLPPGVSPALDRILRKSLAFRPEDRYPTAAAFGADLEALLAGRRPASTADPAPVEDLHATRYTARPEAAAGLETRRTVAAAPAGTASPWAPGGRRLWAPVLLLLLLGLAGTQAWVRSEARKVERELAVEPVADLDATLSRYRNAARLSLFGLGLGTVSEDLRQELVRAAEGIFAGYRGDEPTTTDRDWQRAHDYLRTALAIGYRDAEGLARLTYVRAHLDRLEAQELRARGEEARARAASERAVQGFQQAAQADADWPDPHLALAWIYTYDRFDLDRLQQTIGQLSRRGYPLGKRETEMLADGFRTRGIELQEHARQAAKPEDRKADLAMARAFLGQALEYYASIRGYSNSETNRDDAARRLAEVRRRL
jgi:eukaryotic-like serine/threonine-protein kinase